MSKVKKTNAQKTAKTSKKPRKIRVDSAESLTKTLACARKDIQPPKHVTLLQRDKPFFSSVISEFANVEWTDHKIELAALLARAMSDMEYEQRQLRAEGAIATSLKGTPVVNPRKTVVQMYASTIFAMRRSLSLHARAQGGEAGRVGKQKAITKKAQEAADDADDLINMPTDLA